MYAYTIPAVVKLQKLSVSTLLLMFLKATPQERKLNRKSIRMLSAFYNIDMEQMQYSKTFDKIPTPDIAISMGCDVGCPYIGREFDNNWCLPDPTGQSDEEFERIISLIKNKVIELKLEIQSCSK